MTLEELYTKWRVGPCEVDAVIANRPDLPPFKMHSWEHSAPIGDFIRDYMDHRAISWWNKKYDWKIVEGCMREALNRLHIKFYGRL